MACVLYVSAAGDDKILLYAMHPDTGELALRREIAVPGAPGPLAVDRERALMYAALRGSRELVTFHLDMATGDLRPSSRVALRSDPCYIAPDRTGRFLLSAYYAAGMVTVHRIGADGALSAQPIQVVETGPHAHCIQTDLTNRFAYVPHTVPTNAIFQFSFAADTGQLAPLSPPRAAVPDGVGPRHYCHHPRRDMVYVSNEQGSSASAYRMNPATGALTWLQTVSTLPAGYTGENTTAQIHLHPTGRFLYVSNRGHDSIAILAVDETTGHLTSVGQQPSEPTPRTFNLDPGGRYLYAAGQGSGKLAAYRIDQSSGRLAPIATYEAGRNPMWVLILPL